MSTMLPTLKITSRLLIRPRILRMQALSTNSTSSTAKVEEQEQKTTWVNVSGLSRHSTKEDVKYAFPDVPIHAAIPYLDYRYLPFGAWAVEIPTEYASSIRRDTPLLVGRLTTPKASIIKKPTLKSRLTNQFDISPRTVLVSRIPDYISEDHIRYFFKGLTIKRIRDVGRLQTSTGRPIGKEGKSFWLDFEDREQAAIAAQEGNGHVLSRSRIRAFHYDFIASDSITS